VKELESSDQATRSSGRATHQMFVSPLLNTTAGKTAVITVYVVPEYPDTRSEAQARTATEKAASRKLDVCPGLSMAVTPSSNDCATR
jgi:hypothetical protein